MKRKHIIALVVLGVVAVIVVGAVIAVNLLQNDLVKQVSEITIADVDLAKVPDGTYDGKYKVFPVAVEVRVSVENHRITGIDLVKHDNGQGKPAGVIPGKVTEAQSLNVDIVSGATYSSKVILKAIENALAGAVK